MIINPYAFVSGGGTAGAPFVTGQTLSAILRNDGGGYSTGFAFTVGGSGITVTALGRWKASGDSASHSVSLYTVSGNASTIIAVTTVLVDMSQAPDADGYVYAAITPYALSASTSYSIMSVETNGVDHFYENDTRVTTTAAASVYSWAYKLGGSQDIAGSSGLTYGPMNFKYA